MEMRTTKKKKTESTTESKTFRDEKIKLHFRANYFHSHIGNIIIYQEHKNKLISMRCVVQLDHSLHRSSFGVYCFRVAGTQACDLHALPLERIAQFTLVDV